MRSWKDIVLGSPELFILRYFGERLELLKDFHLRLIHTALHEPRGLILYPAGHGKTTLVSTILPIYELCKDPNDRIAIIAKNEQDAKGIMRSIHGELLGNMQLIEDFGPFHDPLDQKKAWTLERIDLCTRTKPVSKEGSIQIYGSKGNVLGKRFDHVICDDVVTDKNSNTPEQRQSMREWFNLGVETMPEYPWSRLTVVGTLFDPEDLYHDLRTLVIPETNEKIYTEQLEDAITDEDEHTTLWPERWTWERLMAQKAKMGTIDFNKRYRNVAVDESRLVFKHEYIWGGYIGKEEYPGCLDEDYSIGDYADNWRRVAGFDPAIGSSKQAKFCAHCVLALGSCTEHEKCYWVVDLFREQLTMPQQVDLLISSHQNYDLFASVIEVNGYQQGLKDAVDKQLFDDGLSYNILPHHTSRNTKPDPELGVTSMKRMVANGQLHIPWKTPHDREVMAGLIDEMEQYPGKFSDRVMALWFAWKVCQEQGPRYASYNRLDRPRPSIYARKGNRRSVQNPAYGQSTSREPDTLAS